jgi:hypothetical protein
VIASADEIAWDGGLSIQPAKGFLLPQTEPLLSFNRTGPLELTPLYDETKRVFLGIRSCDVCGIGYLDRVLSREFQDPYYLARRSRAALVSLTCPTPPHDTCFCVCANAGPFLQSGYDLQLTDLQDRFLVEIGSERGRELVAARADLFADAPVWDVQSRRFLEAGSHDQFGPYRAYMSASMRGITLERVDQKLWARLADYALLGGGFAYGCPVCNCFNVVDTVAGDRGTRTRIWDSCELESHAREASGHNPRKARAERIRHRFTHKLHYANALRNGSFGCVGCGRCIRTCLGADTMPETAYRIEHSFEDHQRG